MEGTAPPGTRFRESASRQDGGAAEEARAWLDARAAEARFSVEAAPLSALRQWRLDEDEGAFVHDTGRFFRIEGLRTAYGDRPVIIQPEIGILGMVARDIDGCVHFLMQAKAEPGNPRRFQLAPTVQATPSNYTRVHGGAAQPFLEWFMPGSSGRVLVDQVQPEHGGIFLAKRNRNVIVEALHDFETGLHHRWLTLGQIQRLLAFPNVVSMDTRSLLSCIPLHPRGVALDPALAWWLRAAAPFPSAPARIGLRDMQGWRCGDEIVRDDGRSFLMRGIRVETDSREVRQWDQPMVAARERGLIAFLMQRIDGTLHLLAQALVECGAPRGAAVAPTVQGSLGACGDLPFHPLVATAPAAWVRYACTHSEEGGRFLEVETEHRLVELPADFPLALPPRFRWVSLAQMEALIREARVNLEARSLLACLGAAGAA